MNERMMKALPIAHIDVVRRIYIACAWTVALTDPNEPELDVATGQMFILVGELMNEVWA